MKNAKALRPRQLDAIHLLAKGIPINQVAELIEVSRMTIHRWQRLPAFQAKLNATTASGLEEFAKKLNGASLTAVETVQDVLGDLRAHEDIRLKAAMCILRLIAPVNGVLHKDQRRRIADFDPNQRWKDWYTQSKVGRPCKSRRKSGNASPDTLVEV